MERQTERLQLATYSMAFLPIDQPSDNHPRTSLIAPLTHMHQDIKTRGETGSIDNGTTELKLTIRNSRERESMRNNGYHELGVGTVCPVHIVLLFSHKHMFSLQEILALPFFSTLTQPSVRPSVGLAFLKNQEFKEI